MAKKATKKTAKKASVKKSVTKIVPVETKPKTIRDVPVTDSQAFNDLADHFNITPGELFSKMITMYNEGADAIDVSMYTDEIEQLKTKITELENAGPGDTNNTDLHNQIKDLQDENDKCHDKIQKLMTALESKTDLQPLLDEKVALIETLSDKITELENQQPAGVKLDASKNEFVAFITEENFKDARKCRPFLAKDNYVSGDPAKYPNELINVAINYFLHHRYDRIVNP